MGWQDAPIVGDASAPSQSAPGSAAPRWMQAPITNSGPAQSIPTMTIKPQPDAPVPSQQMTPMQRFGTGLKDPIEGGAQLLTHVLPDSIVKPINAANNWLADKTGLVEKLPPGGMDEEAERRAKTIKQQSPTGIDWWRVAGNVASPANYVAPTKLLGAANGARRVGSAVLQGALTGAMQPVESRGDYAGKKIDQALFGGITGGALAGGVEVARPLAKWAIGLHGDVAARNQAIKNILTRIETDQKGGGVTFQQMLDIANATPEKPLVLADVLDANAKSLLGRIARAPGTAQQVIKKFLNDRDLDTATRVTGDVADTLGDGAAYYADQSLKDARSAAAKPLFKAAFANNMPLDSVYLQDILETNPLVQEGMRRGWQIEQNEAQGEFDAATGSYRPIDWADYGITNVITDPQTGQVTLELGQVPNLRLWHTVKQGLDAKIEELESANNGEPTRMSVSIKKLRAGIVRELDRLSPGYKEAREAWAGPTLARQALEFGQKFANKSPEQIDHIMQEMSASEREFARLGLANTLRKTILSTGSRGDETRKLMLPWTKLQLRAFFDSDAAFDKFFASLNAEKLMWESWAKINVGSNSADKLAEDMRPNAQAASHAIRGGMDMAGGNALGAFAHWIQGLGRVLPSENPKVTEMQAKLLKMPVAPAVRVLQGATNTAPAATVYPQIIPGLVGAATPGDGTGQ